MSRRLQKLAPPSGILIEKSIIRALGGVEEAAFLTYIDSIDDGSGKVYVTSEEIECDIALTRRKQDRIRRLLRDLGVLEEGKDGWPARQYFVINETRLSRLVEAPDSLFRRNVQTDSLDETYKQDPVSTKRTNSDAIVSTHAGVRSALVFGEDRGEYVDNVNTFKTNSAYACAYASVVGDEHLEDLANILSQINPLLNFRWLRETLFSSEREIGKILTRQQIVSALVAASESIKSGLAQGHTVRYPRAWSSKVVKSFLSEEA